MIILWKGFWSIVVILFLLYAFRLYFRNHPHHILEPWKFYLDSICIKIKFKQHKTCLRRYSKNFSESYSKSFGRSNHPEVFLKISQNSQENTCARASFLMNLLKTSLLKRRLWHRFSCEFCEMFKNTFFTEHLWDCFCFKATISGKAFGINSSLRVK